MKKLFFILAILFGLSSCTTPPGIFHFGGIKLVSNGINITKDKDGGYIGEVPPEGCKFSITGKGKNKGFTYVTVVEINDEMRFKKYEDPMDTVPQYTLEPELQGDWGEIVNNEKEYKIFFTVNPNNTSEMRKFRFTLGYGYWNEILCINQPPMKAE